MDDVNMDYSKLIKNILLEVDFVQVYYGRWEKKYLRVVFLEEGLSVDHYTDDSDEVVVKYKRPGHNTPHSFRNSCMDPNQFELDIGDKLRGVLLRYNIGIDYHMCLDSDDVNYEMIDNQQILNSIEFSIYGPVIELPEPETEGGYESWMM